MSTPHPSPPRSSTAAVLRRPRRMAAFTLLEVMMAVTILALTITTAITTMQRAFNNLDAARNVDIGCRILQCQMEKERLLTWAQVSDSAYRATIDAAFTGDPAVAGRFSLSRQTAVVANRGGKLLQITLTVTWKNYDGHSTSRSQTTYYGNGGLYTYLTTQK